MLEKENRISDARTEGLLWYCLTLFLQDILVLLNLNYISGQ